jgi:hypothetical protein
VISIYICPNAKLMYYTTTTPTLIKIKVLSKDLAILQLLNTGPKNILKAKNFSQINRVLNSLPYK